jgi:hypothetical protein
MRKKRIANPSVIATLPAAQFSAACRSRSGSECEATAEAARISENKDEGGTQRSSSPASKIIEIRGSVESQ